jgi:hypothetical protein
MTKKKQINKKYLIFILAVGLIVVGGGILWLNYEAPYVNPSLPVTYHIGDSIGNSGFVFINMYGTGAVSNDLYLYFSSPPTGSIQQQVSVGNFFSLGGHTYTLISYGQGSITLSEMVFPIIG